MVAILSEIAEITNLQELVSQQFRAKSQELAGLTAEALVNGDQKVFTFRTDKYEGSIGFAVIETTDDDVILSRADELLVALSNDNNPRVSACYTWALSISSSSRVHFYSLEMKSVVWLKLRSTMAS
jgi:inorganic pyrophosphatase/exopolyphosphatase